MTDTGEQQPEANGAPLAATCTPSPRLPRSSSASLRRRSGCFLIGIAGGTASGKTTVCRRIMDRLQDQCARLIHQDSFYRGLTKEELANVKSEFSCKQHSRQRCIGLCFKHPHMLLYTFSTQPCTASLNLAALHKETAVTTSVTAVSTLHSSCRMITSWLGPMWQPDMDCKLYTGSVYHAIWTAQVQCLNARRLPGDVVPLSCMSHCLGRRGVVGHIACLLNFAAQCRHVVLPVAFRLQL